MVAPEHQDTHQELTLWGRWARSGAITGRCGSIEHNYRPPPCWHPPEPRPELPTDTQALETERLMRHLRRLPRLILKFVYVFRADGTFISRRLKFREWEYDERLYSARQAFKVLTLQNNLGTLTQIRYPGESLRRPSGDAIHF